MKDIQNEAALVFQKNQVQDDTHNMGLAIDESDSILKDLEEMLIEYKINLDEMKCEMHLLQEKTSQMSTSRNNRKNFQKELSKFLDVVMLEPELMNTLSNGQIDGKYCEAAEKYRKVLLYIKGNNFEGSIAFKEISKGFGC